MTTPKRNIILIADDIRSCYNVGSLMRTADGLGIFHFYLAGYTPYPATEDDSRLPHVATRLTRQIHKTALGAENSLPWSHSPNAVDLIKALKREGFSVAALEQTDRAVSLADFKPPNSVALIVGNETEGLSQKLLGLADVHLSIPMLGSKESFNVVQAAAMALYHLRFGN